MKHVLAIVLALNLSCFPPSNGQRASAPRQESWNAPPPEPKPSSFQEFSCYSQLALSVTGHSQAVQAAVLDWGKRADPLLEQFNFTPWEAIPDHVKPQVEQEWRQIYREFIAKKAISLGVPVSSIVCVPEYPDCDKFTPDKNEGHYLSVLRTKLMNLFKDVEELSTGNENVRIALGSGLDSAILSEVSRQHGRLGAVYGGFNEFLFGMLPKDAVLPPIDWPKEPEPPFECKGVMKFTK